ncbi:MAG: pentapeptide repeat-containing protein [Anaerolineae bacterium]|nr:pentapeptide repeat-containing protein [Anaerolineae bacterium]
MLFGHYLALVLAWLACGTQYEPDADLTGRDLSGRDLSDKDLTNALLVDANLSEVDLTNAILTGADLSGADLSDAVLTGTDLSDADLENAILNGLDLTDTTLTGADLTGAQMDGVDLSGMDLSDIELTGADLTDADLNGANLNYGGPDGLDMGAISLQGADLSEADLSYLILTDSNLSGANLHGANLFKTVLDGVSLSGADLGDVDLAGRDLTGWNLAGASLQGANLSGADLSGLDLSDVELAGANMAAANLSGVDLSGKDLRDWTLSRANLTGANLTGANLSGMDLTDLTLIRTDLSNADLSKAILEGQNLTSTLLYGANLQGANLREITLGSGSLVLSSEVGRTNMLSWSSADGAEILMTGSEVDETDERGPGTMIRQWDISTGEMLSEEIIPLYSSLSCSPDATRIAGINEEGISIWYAADGKIRSYGPVESDEYPYTFTYFHWAPDNQHVVMLQSFQDTVLLIDSASDAEPVALSFPGMDQFPWSIWSPDSRYLGVRTDTGYRVWDWKDSPDEPLWDYTSLSDDIGYASWDITDSHLAMVVETTDIQIQDIESGADVHLISGDDLGSTGGEPEQWGAIVYSPESDRLAANTISQSVVIWDTGSFEIIAQIDEQQGGGVPLEWLDNDTLLLYNYTANRAAIYHIDTGEVNQFLMSDTYWTTYAASESGQYIAFSFGSDDFVDDIFVFNTQSQALDVNLAGADLTGARLNSIDLREANLSDADLSEAALSGINLSGLDLTSTDLESAVFDGGDLSQTNLSGISLNGVQLNGVNLQSADLSQTTLKEAQLESVDLSQSTLAGTDFSGSTITLSSFSGSSLIDTNFLGADMYSIDLSGALLDGTMFERSAISGADLTDIELIWADPIEPFVEKSICGDGVGIATMGSYDPDGEGPHPLVMQQSSGFASDIPDEWKADREHPPQLAACATEESALVQSCQYYYQSGVPSGTIDRYRKSMTIVLYDAQTGEEIASTTQWGSIPDACPWSTYNLYTIYGGLPGFSAFEDWLISFVAP